MPPKKKTLEGEERTNERYQNRKENSRKSDDDDELRGTAGENEKGGGTEDGRSVITCTTAELRERA